MLIQQQGTDLCGNTSGNPNSKDDSQSIGVKVVAMMGFL